MSLPPLSNARSVKKWLDEGDVQVVDATWVLPGSRDPLRGQYIPGAIVLDMDAIKSAHPEDQSPEFFATHFYKAGHDESKPTVFYDRLGIFSAPRGLWMAKQAGISDLSVLDGGLPAWVAARFETSSQFAAPNDDARSALSGYKRAIKLNRSYNPVTDCTVLGALGTDVQIVDARPADRFYGKAPEPRPNMRSGRIPQSISLPFGDLKTPDGKLLGVRDLVKTVHAAGIDLARPIITTCGSGITAAGLAFVFGLLGKNDVQVYSGSWSEWGAMDSGLPIEI